MHAHGATSLSALCHHQSLHTLCSCSVSKMLVSCSTGPRWMSARSCNRELTIIHSICTFETTACPWLILLARNEDGGSMLCSVRWGELSTSLLSTCQHMLRIANGGRSEVVTREAHIQPRCQTRRLTTGLLYKHSSSVPYPRVVLSRLVTRSTTNCGTKDWIF